MADIQTGHPYQFLLCLEQFDVFKIPTVLNTVKGKKLNRFVQMERTYLPIVREALKRHHSKWEKILISSLQHCILLIIRCQPEDVQCSGPNQRFCDLVIAAWSWPYPCSKSKLCSNAWLKYASRNWYFKLELRRNWAV